MDKRFNTLSISEQLGLRKEAVEDAMAHSKWALAQSIRHLKKTVRLTTAEMAKLSDVSYRTMQDIEQDRSEGTVQTMNRIFGMLGLKLGSCARGAGLGQWWRGLRREVFLHQDLPPAFLRPARASPAGSAPLRCPASQRVRRGSLLPRS
ncbi:hypothetical protein OOZ63_19365 [Paucibacter sp. PLA-PC-4]|uniref:hypothetical protein n=1 Tax=Paucibacter sp. PLA-PC-4 TaxID=2993655 RepID=UPI00224AD04B|nr:hypothetical protein [Paucibacter sp. PLA-PC-4]MCX2863991.1 hypothetical protein [Paucibacter sp. PLA-PC-4]